MREIKFRAWNKKSRQMYDVLEVQLQNHVVRSHTTSGVLIKHRESTVFCEMNVVELMQYTGLKDKNLTSIYEGDIVSEKNSVGVITYVEDGFEIDWKIDRDFWSNTLKFHAEHLEVIGNVFKNPELIQP